MRMNESTTSLTSLNSQLPYDDSTASTFKTDHNFTNITRESSTTDSSLTSHDSSLIPRDISSMSSSDITTISSHTVNDLELVEVDTTQSFSPIDHTYLSSEPDIIESSSWGTSIKNDQSVTKSTSSLSYVETSEQTLVPDQLHSKILKTILPTSYSSSDSSTFSLYDSTIFEIEEELDLSHLTSSASEIISKDNVGVVEGKLEAPQEGFTNQQLWFLVTGAVLLAVIVLMLINVLLKYGSRMIKAFGFGNEGKVGPPKEERRVRREQMIRDESAANGGGATSGTGTVGPAPCNQHVTQTHMLLTTVMSNNNTNRQSERRKKSRSKYRHNKSREEKRDEHIHM